MKPSKLSIVKPSHQRDPNHASPTQTPTPVGDFTNHDKDYSKWSNVSPEEINKLHGRDDVDKSALAHHHTLGTGRAQASPGSHVHDGTNSKKLGQGLGLTITGAKGGNVALTNLLAYLAKFMDFKDTTT
jgi:hypothetical protein